MVQIGEENWLLDASPDLRYQWPEVPLHGVMLTHAHAGHIAGLQMLGKEGADVRTPLVVTPGMAQFLRNNEPWNTIASRMDLQSREPGEAWGPWQFHPIVHRAELSDTVAISMRGRHTVLYLPDTDQLDGAVAAAVATLVEGDTLLMDGTFYGEDLQHRDMGMIPHPLIRDMLNELRQLTQRGVQVILTHINHTNPLNDALSEASLAVQEAGLFVAHDGMVIEA